MRIVNRKPMIYWVLRRVIEVGLYDGIILALPNKKKDKLVSSYVKKIFPKVLIYFGSENNVLDRYYRAAKKFKADIISRVTADDPLKDIKIMRKSLKYFINSNLDYYSNTIKQSYPLGLDIEHFKFNVLKLLKKKAKSNYDREHVTSFIKSNQNLFKLKNFCIKKDLSNIRFTVDTLKDLKQIRKIYKYLNNDLYINYITIIKNFKLR